MRYSDNNAPSFIEALKVWIYIGLLSFGGPAAQVALMHREVSRGKKMAY